jgi:type I restriction enzyme, R subunit
MTARHTERAFEDAIEHHLLTHGGWSKGDPKDFDRQLALAPKDFFTFVQATQPVIAQYRERAPRHALFQFKKRALMPFTDPDLEKLYTFGRYLELKLPRDEKKASLALDGEVALRYYRLDKINEGQIVLTFAEPVALRSPTDLGTRQARDEQAALSEIIDVLNERFGTQFGEADQLLFDQFATVAKQDPRIVNVALANALDNFELAMKPKVEGLMLDRMDQNQEIVNRYLNDPEFQTAAFKALVRKIYEDIRRGASPPPPSR